MGSAYVNDFDFNNRSYRVYVQADKQFRSHPSDIRQFYVRAEGGTMVSLDNLVNVTQSTTPGVITHYNLFRSAEVNGAPAPGRSSGQAIAAMDALSTRVLPAGFGLFQESNADEKSFKIVSVVISRVAEKRPAVTVPLVAVQTFALGQAPGPMVNIGFAQTNVEHVANMANS